MHYFIYRQPGMKIEFLNSFSGRETVKLNGRVVSEKSSIMGTDHHFEVAGEGGPIQYTLRTKIGGHTMVMIDLIRDGNYILSNEPVAYGNPDQRNKATLQKGLKHLREFELDEAMEIFKGGLNTDSDNEEFHFYKACCHSLKEEPEAAFEHLEHAIKFGINKELILSEDALAYIRVLPRFSEFQENFINKKTNQ